MFRLSLALLLPALVSGLGLYETEFETHWWCCTDAFCQESCCPSGKVPADDPPSDTPPSPVIENFFNWTATGLTPDPIDPPNEMGFLSSTQVWQVRKYAEAFCEMKFDYTCTIVPPGDDPVCDGTVSGDPHFKTWLGKKFDYHGECDLVMVDNPSFNNGQGLKIHIRTTRVKYYSFIEKVAVQIGDDVLEFANDVDNFLVNGVKADPNRKHHKTLLGGFVVRRDKKALSIRLSEDYRSHDIAKINLHARKTGFPGVVIDVGRNAEMFKGSMGLLGEWPMGRTLARDGVREIPVEQFNSTEFALEWQVRDTEPMLFSDARAPQYPQQCIPPAKMLTNRLGMTAAKKEAEEACAHWADKDKEDCIFDVIATRDVLVAQEGSVVTVG